MRYEITEDNDVLMWDDINPEPFLHQPFYPNGDLFDTAEEAEEWAQYKLEELTIPEAPEAPLGKGLPAKPKPTLEEMRLLRLQAIGLTIDDFKEMLGLK